MSQDGLRASLEGCWWEVSLPLTRAGSFRCGKHLPRDKRLGSGCPYLKITEQFTSGKLLSGKFCFHLGLHLDLTYSATICDRVSALLMAHGESREPISWDFIICIGRYCHIYLKCWYIPSLQAPGVTEQSTLKYFFIHSKKTARNTFLNLQEEKSWVFFPVPECGPYRLIYSGQIEAFAAHLVEGSRALCPWNLPGRERGNDLYFTLPASPGKTLKHWQGEAVSCFHWGAKTVLKTTLCLQFGHSAKAFCR